MTLNLYGSELEWKSLLANAGIIGEWNSNPMVGVLPNAQTRPCCAGLAIACSFCHAQMAPRPRQQNIAKPNKVALTRL